MDPAALRPELLGDGVDERGECRGRSSARSRRRARASAPAPRADRGDVRGRNGADLGPAVERRELDLEPARELALLRPDPAHLRPGVAGDHSAQSRAGSGGRSQPSARIRAASTAAFFALSTPTVATGTPGGIWTIESSASSPSSTRHRRAQRDADHRQLGVRRDDARAARRRARRRRSAPAGRAAAPTSRTRRPRRASGAPSAPRTPRRSRARRARRAPPASARGPTRSRRGSRPAGSATRHRRDVAAELDALERDQLDRRVRAGRAPPRPCCPVPVTERILPPFVTTRAVPHRRAAVEDERPRRARRRRGPRSARRRSRSGPDSPGRRARPSRPLFAAIDGAAPARSPPRPRASSVEQVAFDARHQHLRLRVAEPRVELEHLRAVRGHHQPGEEAADERRAAAGELVDHGLVDPLDELVGVVEPPRPASRRPCRRCSGPCRRRRRA